MAKQAQVTAEMAQDAKLGRELVAKLSTVVGDTGKSESAVEVLERLLAEHHVAKK